MPPAAAAARGRGRSPGWRWRGRPRPTLPQRRCLTGRCRPPAAPDRTQAGPRRRRIPVLGGEPVVDGDDPGLRPPADLRGQLGGQEGVPDHVHAAVEVQHHVARVDSLDSDLGGRDSAQVRDRITNELWPCQTAKLRVANTGTAVPTSPGLLAAARHRSGNRHRDQRGGESVTGCVTAEPGIEQCSDRANSCHDPVEHHRIERWPGQVKIPRVHRSEGTPQADSCCRPSG
jgi:hypothetical protein